MARPKKTEEISDIEIDDGVAKAVRSVEKLYGAGTVKMAAEITKRTPKIVSISPILDTALGGGIPEGSWVHISGPPKVGKSSAALTLCANAQKMGKAVIYIDAEGRTTKKLLKGIKGLDVDKMIYIGPKEGVFYTSKDYLRMAEAFVKDVPGCVIVIDSISSLLNPSLLEEDYDKADFGSGNRIIGRFCDVCAQCVPVNGTILIGIVHFYANTSGYGKANIEKAAQRWFYQSDVRLRANPSPKPLTTSKDSNAPYGQIVTWNIDTSALGPPVYKVESYLRYGVGIDKIQEIIHQAAEVGIVNVSGSWYSYGEYKVQGSEAMYALLSENEELLEKIEKELKEVLV